VFILFSKCIDSIWRKNRSDGSVIHNYLIVLHRIFGKKPHFEVLVKVMPGFVRDKLEFLKIMLENFACLPVLRIRDVYPGSEFFDSGSRVKKIPDPRSPIRIKEFKYF
jgi:hypothetical protein